MAKTPENTMETVKGRGRQRRPGRNTLPQEPGALFSTINRRDNTNAPSFKQISWQCEGGCERMNEQGTWA
jgi:hypothetical protein